MDHHCPWINVCVGHNNHAAFTRFVFYTPLGCLHAAVVNANFLYCLFTRVSNGRTVLGTGCYYLLISYTHFAGVSVVLSCIIGDRPALDRQPVHSCLACACSHTHTHTHTHMHTHTHPRTHMHTHTHTHMHTPTHTHMHTPTCTHTHTHAHTHAHPHTPTCTHPHTRTCTHPLAHTHTHTHICWDLSCWQFFSLINSDATHLCICRRREGFNILHCLYNGTTYTV